jgi:hypothetical protein
VWHSEGAGRTAAVQPSKKVAANWDDEGNPVSRETDRKKT